MNAREAKQKAMENLKTSDVYKKVEIAIEEATSNGETECAILTKEKLTKEDERVLKDNGFVINKIGSNFLLGYVIRFDGEYYENATIATTGTSTTFAYGNSLSNLTI